MLKTFLATGLAILTCGTGLAAGAASKLADTRELLPGLAIGAHKSSLGKLVPAPSEQLRRESPIRFGANEFRDIVLGFKDDRLSSVSAAAETAGSGKCPAMLNALQSELRSRFSDGPRLMPPNDAAVDEIMAQIVRERAARIAQQKGAAAAMLLAGEVPNLNFDVTVLEFQGAQARCRLEIFYAAPVPRQKLENLFPPSAPPASAGPK